MNRCVRRRFGATAECRMDFAGLTRRRARRLASGLASVALVSFVVYGGAGSAMADPPPVTGTGVFSCATVTGTIMFNPHLVSSPPQNVTTTVILNLSGCSGTANPLPSHISARVVTNNMTCRNLAVTTPVNIALSYAATSPPASIASSPFVGTSRNWQAGGRVRYDVFGHIASGSYVSPAAKFHMVVSQVVTTIIRECSGNPARGGGVGVLTIISPTPDHSTVTSI